MTKIAVLLQFLYVQTYFPWFNTVNRSVEIFIYNKTAITERMLLLTYIGSWDSFTGSVKVNF